MFTVDDKYAIEITCGDTAALELTFTGDPPGQSDQVIAALKKSAGSGQEAIWEKSLALTGSGTDQGHAYSTWIMALESEDTSVPGVGSYYWDMRVLYADGQITTPFPPAAFKILSVVTDLPEE